MWLTLGYVEDLQLGCCIPVTTLRPTITEVCPPTSPLIWIDTDEQGEALNATVVVSGISAVSHPFPYSTKCDWRH
jgi:hypothetical protein